MTSGPALDPTLAALAAELREEESVLAHHVIDPDPGASAALGRLAAAGQRTGEPYAAIAEWVREGYLLHYSEPRILAPPDRDLALLAGDYLYAKGLDRLAALGDLAAVQELADLISLSAVLHADGPPDDADAPHVLWLASMVAIAMGPDEAHDAAKNGLRQSGDAEALSIAMRDSAAAAGLDEQLFDAAEAVGFDALDRG